MICPVCRCVFCPDPPAEPGDPPAVTCSKACRRRARKLRRQARESGGEMPPPLPGWTAAQLTAAAADARALLAEDEKAAGRCAAQGKIPYPDEAAAWADLHRINALAGLGLDGAYRCDGCGCWHLTSHGYTAIRVTVRGRGELGLLDGPGILARALGQAS